MDISVITVTWNAEDFIAEQIKSVRLACKNISYEQFIVDNGSADKTVEVITKNFPEIKLIRNDKNTGFGFPNNQAAKLAQGDFLLFLNPDMKVEEGGLAKMVEWMRKNPEAGIASCKLVKKDGSFNDNAKPRRFPTIWNQLAIAFKIPHFFPAVLDNYLYKNFDPDKEQEVDSVRGSFLLIRKEVYQKLGWAFDPRYFVWFEDVDTCREVKKIGFKVMYVPVMTCVDLVGQSFKRRGFFWKQKLFFSSMFKYFWKWGI
jgi:GT2 family glycosyltransferase